MRASPTLTVVKKFWPASVSFPVVAALVVPESTATAFVAVELAYICTGKLIYLYILLRLLLLH